MTARHKRARHRGLGVALAAIATAVGLIAAHPVLGAVFAAGLAIGTASTVGIFRPRLSLRMTTRGNRGRRLS